MRRNDRCATRQWPLYKHPVCWPRANTDHLPYIRGTWCVTDTVSSAVNVQQQQTKQDNRQSGDGDDDVDDDDGKICSLFTPLIHGGMWLIKSGTRGDMKLHMKSFGSNGVRLILVTQIQGNSDKRKFTIDEFNAMYLVPDSST